MRISKPPLSVYRVNNPKYQPPRKKYPVNHTKVNLTRWIIYIVVLSAIAIHFLGR